VYVKRLDPSVLAFSLSLYQHPFIQRICINNRHILFSSRFTFFNNNNKNCPTNVLHHSFSVTSSSLGFRLFYSAENKLTNVMRVVYIPQI
jgi:hypothetical protein